jgi:acyl carrier protein
MENLINVISKSIKIDFNELTENSSLLNDLCLDSIETVKLCKDLIEQFNCQIEVIDIKKADNIKNIYQMIQETN